LLQRIGTERIRGFVVKNTREMHGILFDFSEKGGMLVV
jgi:hypothetical protein